MVLRKVSFQVLDWEDHGDPLMLDLHGLFHQNPYSGLSMRKNGRVEPQERRGESRQWEIVASDTCTESIVFIEHFKLCKL